MKSIKIYIYAVGGLMPDALRARLWDLWNTYCSIIYEMRDIFVLFSTEFCLLVLAWIFCCSNRQRGALQVSKSERVAADQLVHRDGTIAAPAGLFALAYALRPRLLAAGIQIAPAHRALARRPSHRRRCGAYHSRVGAGVRLGARLVLVDSVLPQRSIASVGSGSFLSGLKSYDFDEQQPTMPTTTTMMMTDGSSGAIAIPENIVLQGFWVSRAPLVLGVTTPRKLQRMCGERDAGDAVAAARGEESLRVLVVWGVDDALDRPLALGDEQSTFCGQIGARSCSALASATTTSGSPRRFAAHIQYEYEYQYMLLIRFGAFVYSVRVQYIHTVPRPATIVSNSCHWINCVCTCRTRKSGRCSWRACTRWSPQWTRPLIARGLSRSSMWRCGSLAEAARACTGGPVTEADLCSHWRSSLRVSLGDILEHADLQRRAEESTYVPFSTSCTYTYYTYTSY